MDWQNLPEWARYGIVALLSAILGALIALFREALTGLLRRLGGLLAGFVGQNWADRRFERRYLKWMAGECEKVSLIGVFAARPEREPRLSDVFVLPALSEYRRERRLPRDFSAPGPVGATPAVAPLGQGQALPPPELEPEREERRPLPLPEALRRRTAVVLGEPGAGKSTLLRFLALAHARALTGDTSLLRQLDPRAERRLPVLIPLRECASAECSLTAFAEEYVRRQTRGVLSPPSSYFERQARRGRCLFLLDGLDEVLGLGDEVYQGLCDAVNALAVVEEKNRFLVTSRIAGWRGMLSPDFSTLAIDPFDPPRREEFIRKWYQAVEASAVERRESPDQAEIRRRRATERSDDLIRAIERSDRLQRLAANPMLLAVMAMVHRVDMTLPRERAALYRRCTELLLERWDVGRGIADRGATGLTLAQKESLMRRIGYQFHERGVRLLPRREVERLIADVLPALGQPMERAGELLDWVERRTSLLADGEYLTFAHLAFQEYFAAGAILHDEKLRDRLLQVDRLFRPWWREVVLLYAGMADDATDFIRRVYSPEADDLLRRRLFLAGHCIGEAARVEEGLRREIRGELLKVWKKGYRKQREEALRSLAHWSDQEVVDFFVKALRDKNMWVQRGAAEALAHLKIANRETLRALREALKEKDKDAWVRRSAAEALGLLGVADSETLRVLREALRDEDDWVRRSAVVALGHLGSAEKETILAIQEALGDRDLWVRERAAEALARLGITNEEILQFLREALIDGDPWAQERALEAMKRLGVTDDEAFRTFWDTIRDGDTRMRVSAIEALGRLGSADDVTLRVLQDALNDKEYTGVRERAAWALGQLGIAEEGTLWALRKVLKDDAAGVRARAAEALGRLGVANEEIIRALREALKDEHPWVRINAAEALGRLGAANEETIYTLQEALMDKDAGTRWRAAEALGQLRTADPETLHALREALKDEHPWVRDAAFGALWEISERTGVWISR